MKCQRFSEQQIIGIVRKHQAGEKASDLRRWPALSDPSRAVRPIALVHRDLSRRERG